MTTHRSDVLIIGSGISALTCAALLTKRGKSVTVLEQYSKPGGYMHSFKRFGETFDSGAHYMGALGPGQPFRTLLKYLGVLNEEEFEQTFAPLDPTGFDVLKFPDGDVAIPQGYDAVVSELSSIFPNEKSAIRTYFDEMKSVVRHFPTYAFSDETDPMAAAVSLETPLKSFVENLTSNSKLQSVFYSYCNLHGVFPEDTPLGFHAIVTDSLLQGPYGLLGGGDGLVKKFTTLIESQGGKVLTKHKVNRLAIKDRNVTEVVCENGESFSAEWIISSIHPKATFRLLDHLDDFTHAFKERLQSMKESSGIFGVYAATRGGALKPSRNYYYFKSSDPKAMFAPVKPTDEPAMVFASTSKRNWKPGDGKLPVSFLSMSPSEWFAPWREDRYGKRSEGYEEFKKTLATQSLKLVSRYDKDLTEGLLQSVSSTPLTNLHFNGSEDGSGYGTYHSISSTGGRALGPRTKILNLMITGQSCVFPGLLGAAISGLRTTGHILAIKPMLKELKEMGMNQ
jgi:all-trans-retinol 13,14-reductase